MSRSAAVPALALAFSLALACAGPPRLADPSRSGVWGYLRLVPHEGVPAAGPIAGTPRAAYIDRRYAGAKLVDYTRPGFAVVYLEGVVQPPPPLDIAIEAGLSGARLVPALGATAVGGTLRVENRSGAARVLSCPAAGVLRRLAPGESLEFAAARPGEVSLFVPGETSAVARVFAAPGPFARAAADGRYELVDVAPGTARLHVWHPRFPPRSQALALAPGRVERVDVELGVGLDADRSGGPERAHAD